MLTNIPYIQVLQNLYCWNCPWLNINNSMYDKKIKKLILLQLWLKRINLSKKIKKLIPQLIPLYYHPLAKGGYIHKKNMFKFILKI